MLTGEGQLPSALESVGLPMVLKAQLPLGGRGKAGAIVKVKDREELLPSYRQLSSTTISGLPVTEILAERFVPHDRELYCSYFQNRSLRGFSLIVAREGGVDVETVRDKFVADFFLEGPSPGQYEEAATYLGLEGQDRASFVSLLKSLYDLYQGVEGDLVEVNPLAYSPGTGFVALDAKVVVDDNALFRHPELKGLVRRDAVEEDAEKYGFNFVPLEGDVAVVGNGAGLVLATLDMVSSKGVKPGCFLDLGGGASAERVLAALKLLNSQPNLKAYFVNVFGGITNSVYVAQGILQAREQGILTKPLIMRLSGAGEEEAREMLAREGLRSYVDEQEALNALEEWRSP